jgi:hypothetical protein
LHGDLAVGFLYPVWEHLVMAGRKWPDAVGEGTGEASGGAGKPPVPSAQDITHFQEAIDGRALFLAFEHRNALVEAGQQIADQQLVAVARQLEQGFKAELKAALSAKLMAGIMDMTQAARFIGSWKPSGGTNFSR